MSANSAFLKDPVWDGAYLLDFANTRKMLHYYKRVESGELPAADELVAWIDKLYEGATEHGRTHYKQQLENNSGKTPLEFPYSVFWNDPQSMWGPAITLLVAYQRVEQLKDEPLNRIANQRYYSKAEDAILLFLLDRLEIMVSHDEGWWVIDRERGPVPAWSKPEKSPEPLSPSPVPLALPSLFWPIVVGASSLLGVGVAIHRSLSSRRRDADSI